MPDKSWFEQAKKSIPKSTEPVLPQYGYSSTQITPTTSSINLKDYTGYTGDVVLSGNDGEDIARLDDLRAQNQSAWEQAKNSALKFGIYAGTTFVDGLAGTAFGLVNMFTGGEDGKIQGSDFWNNPLSNTMTDIQEWSEKALPNYRTAADLDAPFWKKLGTVNFWGDTVFKNLGFAVGALGASALSFGAAGEGLLVKQGLKSLAKNNYGRLARQLGTNADDVARQLADGTLDFSKLTGALARDAKNMKTLNTLQTAQGALMGAMAEARFEAINGARDYYETNKQKYLDLGMSEEEADLKASKESLGVGNTIFALNTALLTMSNASQFKSLLNPGYQVESKAIKGLMLKDGKYAFEGMGKLGKTVSAIKNPLMEGAEELSQTGVESFAKSYYERINDPEATNTINAFSGALGDSFSKMFSQEGLESFFVGMFTGAVGMPNITKAIQDKSIKSAVTGWSGGIAEQLRAIKAEEAKGTGNVEKLNKILESDEFKNNYMNLSASLSAEAAKKRALRNNDEVGYEIANLQSFHSNVQQFIDSGKVDDLYDFLKNQEAKNASTLREEWSVENENKERVDPFKHLSDEEVVEYNRNRVKAQKDLVKRVAEVTNDIETKIPNISPEVKKTLVEAIVTTEFSENKAKEFKQKLIDEIVKFKPKEFDGVKAESIVASAESIESMPDDVQAYLEKNYPNNFNNWKKFTEAKDAAVKLYEYSTNPERLAKKIEKAVEEKAKESFENATKEDPKLGNKFDGVMELRGKIRMKGYEANDDVPITLLDKDGKEVGTATIRNVNGEQLVYSTLQNAPAKLTSLVGKNIKITSKEEKLKKAAQEKIQSKKAILDRMSDQSKRHFRSVNKSIQEAEQSLEKYQKDKEQIQEAFEKAKSKRINKKKLQALIETTEEQLKEVESNIAKLENELSGLRERAQMIQEYQVAIQEEIDNVLQGKEVAEGLQEKIENLKETTGLKSFEFGNKDYLNESIKAANEALSTINEEISTINDELERLNNEKSELESIIAQYKKILPQFESRDEILDSFKSMFPSANLEPINNFIATQFILGKVSKNDLRNELGEELVENLSTFKSVFQKLKDVDLAKYEINLGELSKTIQQHEQLLDDKLKEKSYLETFKKLQNLELVRKGYEATALSTSTESILQKAEQEKEKVIAQEEPEKDVVDYQKDDVGANTYLHIAYDNGFKDVTEQFEFEGNTYTKSKLNDNVYNKAYGEWMSELTNPSKYRLQLVTVNTATDEQKQAITGVNPSGTGEDSIYVFVVDKATGELVRHNGLLLVSSILDSIKNNQGGDRFSIDALESFLKANGIDVKRPNVKQERVVNELVLEINGTRTEIVVANYPSRKEALETFHNEIYSRFGQEYKKIKKALYESINSSKPSADAESIEARRKELISKKSTPEEWFNFLNSLPEGTVFENEVFGSRLVISKPTTRKSGTQQFELFSEEYNEETGEWERVNGTLAILEKKYDGTYWGKPNGDLLDFSYSDLEGNRKTGSPKITVPSSTNTKKEFREITNISNGFSLRVKENAEFTLNKVFKKEDLKNAKVRIAKKNEKYPAGTVLVDFNGREASFKRRKLNNKEVDFLFNLFKFHADKSRSNVKADEYPLFPPAYAKGENTAKFSAVSNLLNFGMNRDGTTKKINREKDQIFTTAEGTLVIVTNVNLDTGELMDKFQSHDFPFDTIAENEKKIKTYLKNKRKNINDAHLSSSKNSVEFSIDDKGVVTSKVTNKKYQDEILEDVLVTNIVPYTVGPQFAQRYFSFDFKVGETNEIDSWDELPVQEVPFEEVIKNDKVSGRELTDEEVSIIKNSLKNQILSKEIEQVLDEKIIQFRVVPYLASKTDSEVAARFSIEEGGLTITLSTKTLNSFDLGEVVAHEYLHAVNSLLIFGFEKGEQGVALLEKVYEKSILKLGKDYYDTIKAVYEEYKSKFPEKTVLINDQEFVTETFDMHYNSEASRLAEFAADMFSDKVTIKNLQTLPGATDKLLLAHNKFIGSEHISVSNDSGLETTNEEPTVTDVPVLENPATDADFGFDAEVKPSSELMKFLDIKDEEAPSFRMQTPGKTLDELIKNNIIEKQCL